MNRFRERVMLALVICVPVPALALSGLSIPLPSVVERIAAALVPFAGAATTEDGATLASGRIVQAPGQKAVRRSSHPTTIRVVRMKTTAAAAARPNVVRVRATSVPASTGPSSTFGEDTTVAAAAPASPAGEAGTPAPGLPTLAPIPTRDETTTKLPTLPTEPSPAAPDVLPDVDLNDELLEPVEEIVSEILPGLELPVLGPPARERRNENLLETLLGGGA